MCQTASGNFLLRWRNCTDSHNKLVRRVLVFKVPGNMALKALARYLPHFVIPGTGATAGYKLLLENQTLFHFLILLSFQSSAFKSKWNLQKMDHMEDPGRWQRQHSLDWRSLQAVSCPVLLHQYHPFAVLKRECIYASPVHCRNSS